MRTTNANTNLLSTHMVRYTIFSRLSQPNGKEIKIIFIGELLTTIGINILGQFISICYAVNRLCFTQTHLSTSFVVVQTGSIVTAKVAVVTVNYMNQFKLRPWPKRQKRSQLTGWALIKNKKIVNLYLETKLLQYMHKDTFKHVFMTAFCVDERVDIGFYFELAVVHHIGH
ncbi:hypothetical protein BLOT_007377 [Blomia tropicalis]|nr:hypothetical protein BLOT_007377 [Blomia tropicalis]